MLKIERNQGPLNGNSLVHDYRNNHVNPDAIIRDGYLK
jgi:hypothetical protein